MKSTSGIWEKNTLPKFYACFYVDSDNFKIIRINIKTCIKFW